LLGTRHEQTVGYGSDAKYKGNGLVISILDSGVLEFMMDDGRTPLVWTSGPGSIKSNESNHIVINVNAKAKMLTFVINGDLWDGGERPFGYARFNPYMYDVNGEEKVSFSKNFNGEIEIFRVYDRFLLYLQGY
jgi:hypothetical protein